MASAAEDASEQGEQPIHNEEKRVNYPERDPADEQKQADKEANDREEKRADAPILLVTFFPQRYCHPDRWKQHQHKGPSYDKAEQAADYKANLLARLVGTLVTRLDRLVHHFDSTAAHEAEVVVSRACTRTASPAKLVAAQATSHVIAALVLLDTGAAHRAKRDVVFVLVCPPCKLALHGLFTSYIFAVPLVTALEADLGAALRTRHLLCIFALSSQDLAALRIDTVPDKRVRVQ